MEKLLKACTELRKNLGYSYEMVGRDLHYCRQNIYYFEHGKSRNYEILLWYIAHGLNVSEYINEKGVLIE